MTDNDIREELKLLHGTSKYHKHLYPGKSPIILTDGCKFIRDQCNAYWLFDAILSYQCDYRLSGINFQIWELRQQKKDLTWLLTCRADKGKKTLINQSVEYSDFPLDHIKLWVIDKVALLPSEY
ncbi:MAG: DUF6876 family protein [Bacteroidales bacterium]